MAVKTFEIHEVRYNEIADVVQNPPEIDHGVIVDALDEWCPEFYKLGLDQICWVAGGFLRDELLNLKSKDVDLYFYSQGDMFGVSDMLQGAGYAVEKETDHVCSLHSKTGKAVQLIWFHEDTPERCVARFDFHACSVAYDPRTNVVWCTKGFLKTAPQRMLVLNYPWYPEDSLRRVERFKQRGWQIDAEEIELLEQMVREDVHCRTKAGRAMVDYVRNDA